MSEELTPQSQNSDALVPESDDDDVEQHGIEIEDDSEAAMFNINIGCV